MEQCCDDLVELLKLFDGLYLSNGKGEISGSTSIDEDGIHISDGWNVAERIPFNYCPYCGYKHIQQEDTNAKRQEP